MQLRKLTIPAGAAFAPMAGLSDAACRRLMADHGAAWTVSEMASAKAITFGDKKSLALLRDRDPHGLYAVQLFGCEPDLLGQAIAILRDREIRFDILDLNMGCPAPKITGGGAGSKLMLDPALCGAMVRAARQALGEDTPLTVKMRTGWDDEHLTGPEGARQCEQNGADLLVVHGRTREQMYIPPVHWDAVAAIKQAVCIPVFANGDITTPERAQQAVEQTGCDGVMIGRGARGNPWIFRRAQAALEGKEIPPLPPLAERCDTAVRQFRLSAGQKGEHIACLEARKHYAWYLKGVPYAGYYKEQISRISTLEDIDRITAGIKRDLRDS